MTQSTEPTDDQWSPAVGDVVAVRAVVRSDRLDPEPWVPGQVAAGLAPWRTAAEIAALEAVAEAGKSALDELHYHFGCDVACETKRHPAFAALDRARSEAGR